MVIETRCRDGRFIGIHIGQSNVRRFFPAHWSSVELLLGHLQIHCDLHPSFWKDHPEICDTRLADWLEAQCRGRQRGCVSLTMTPMSEGCFRLELRKPAVHPAPAASHSAQAATTSPGND